MTAAVAGTVVGVAGLAVLAMPASAGSAPVLPAVSAEQLVQSVLTTKSVPAFAGTVRGTNNLGLPSVPGLGEAGKFLANSSAEVRIWSDGEGRGKLELPSNSGSESIVYDGKTLWDWKSSDHTVRKSEQSPAEHREHPQAASDPATAAKQIIELISKDSTVKVDGTATVAGRSVYQLVLAPKPSERTMLREVRISVDAETKLPLQLSVYGNGSADPVLQIGFSELTIGAQDASLFQFTPPANATVTTAEPKQDKAKDFPGDAASKTVGEGWDTVLVGKLPTTGATDKSGRSQDPMALLKQIAKPVSGAWGSGYTIGASIGNAVVTQDGRYAVGAVPLQVLTNALEQSK
ncbi:sigma-E factor regulatory protein RseB domain-containing protein [Kutzneria viridogrisea]